MVPVKTPAELTDRFRSEGRKLTPQRQAIFHVMHDNQSHPTAEAVHAHVVAELPMVSLRTVYQTLNDLTAMGEIGQVDLGTGSARFDPNVDAHHHLVCEQCGQVEDLHVHFPQVEVPEGRASGFQVTHTEIVFRGRCAPCTTAAPAPTPTTTNHKEA